MKRMTCLGLGVFLSLAVLGGVGEAVVTEIWNLQALEGIRHHLSGDYVLMGDLDFNDDDSYDHADPDWEAKKTAWTTGDGWPGIGTGGFPANPFTGTFDGNNKTISGLYINTGFEKGLFGYVIGGTIENIGLVGINIRGFEHVGGLVGWNQGQVVNSYSTGSVGLSGFESNVGGLVGTNFSGGTITDSHSAASVAGSTAIGGLAGYNGGTIENSYSTGNVGPGDGIVGGLVGWNSSAAVVANSYATGSVVGSFIGGLVGQNAGGTIVNSYATGSVGGWLAGGLAGKNEGQVANSYSTGSVSGGGALGGRVGENTGAGTVLDSFYDEQTSGMGDTGKGEPRTTAGMKNIATFRDAGWDILINRTNLNDGYPFLGWQLGGSPTWYIYRAPSRGGGSAPAPAPGPVVPSPPGGIGASPGEGLSIRVQWAPGAGEDVAQYNLYVSTGGGEGALASGETDDLRFWLLGEFDPETFEHTHPGLTRNVKYYYVITSLDGEGLESAMTSEVLWAVAGTDESGVLPAIEWGPGRIIDAPEAEDSSSCFIAGAAYGVNAPEVGALRDFRDEFLMKNRAGRLMTAAYYRVSPALAGIVGENSMLRFIAAAHLSPLVRAAVWFQG